MSSPLNQNITNLQNLLDKVNALPEAEAPVISVNTSGLITATAGAKSSTHQLAFQAAKTITPTTANQIAVSSGYYTGGSVTVKGDSNLVAGNIKSGVSIFGVNGTYVGSGGSSGDASVEDALITGTISSYINNRVKYISQYAFADCKSLTFVDFPKVTAINSSAFINCKALNSINFPCAEVICDYAFACCSSLSFVDFPKSFNVGKYAFASCINLSSVNFPNVKYIYDNAFYSCSYITSASFPAVVDIYGYAFRKCSRLTSLSFPKVQNISSHAFDYCSKLSIINIGTSSVCVLSRSNAFSGTGIWSNRGSIFVPSSLVASYKTATNWTFFSNRIFSAP